MDGIAHCSHARSPINLRPPDRVVGVWIQLSSAGHDHLLTLNHVLNVLQTSRESTPQSQPRHANRIEADQPRFRRLLGAPENLRTWAAERPTNVAEYVHVSTA